MTPEAWASAVAGVFLRGLGGSPSMHGGLGTIISMLVFKPPKTTGIDQHFRIALPRWNGHVRTDPHGVV